MLAIPLGSNHTLPYPGSSPTCTSTPDVYCREGPCCAIHPQWTGYPKESICYVLLFHDPVKM